MAEFIPFRGILYNPEVILDFSDVVAPPYDVISPREQEMFHARHPNNVIRLILGKTDPADTPDCNVHTRAGAYFRDWLGSGVLVRDARPAFYLTSVTFDLSGQSVTRFGIIGLVRLEPFEKGIVLPHEKTFSKVKSERLQLMKACHANFSPIFSLYSDTCGLLGALQAAVRSLPPFISLKDDKGLQHQLWKITDEKLCAKVTDCFRDQRIYIADGHHRYETALNYKEWVRQSQTAFNDQHPANYILMNLISMEDPGLVILPAHRLLKDVGQVELASLRARMRDFFDIESFNTQEGFETAIQRAGTELNRHSDKNAIGLFIKNDLMIHVLVLKPGVMQRLFGNACDPALLDLDVSVLTQLLMMDLLGFDQARLDDEKRIAYRTGTRESLEAVQADEADLAFILNPTKIDQVKRVSEAGLIMPRKSTYFYPKVISGLLMNTLDPSSK